MDNLKFLKLLGENIRKNRKERGMKLSDLAILINMEETNLIRIEKGRTNPTSLTLKKICRALDINLSSLFSFEADGE